MTTLAALYRTVRTRLTDAGLDTAALDSKLLLEHFTGGKPEDIVCRPMVEVPEAEVRALDTAIARRLAGEPTHRIIGWREFYGLRLALSAGTLEPRPDTETLVEAVLPFVKERIAQTGQCRILDLGTGTGAIPLALLSQVEGATATATDISEDALATAAGNAASNNLASRIEFVRSDWFSAVSGQYDVIVSNPPYIVSEVIPTLSQEVREHDPVAALDGGADGLNAYRAIAANVANFLKPNAIVAVEIGHDQRDSVADLFEQAGFTVDPVYMDLGGNPRVLLFKQAK